MLPLILALSACGPKTPPAAPVPADPLAERPAPGPQQAFSPPLPAVSELSFGSDLWVVPQDGLPLVSLRLVVPGGVATDPDGQAGLTWLADELLTRGAGDRDAAAFAEETERLAISVWTESDARHTIVGLDVHADRLDQGLDLLADAVLRPRFDDEAVALTLDQQRASIQESLDDPRAVASMVAWQSWYGDGHPLAMPSRGTLTTVAGLNAAAARESWAGRAAPSRATFVVAGAVETEALQAALEQRFSGWTDPAEPVDLEVPAPAGAQSDGPVRVFVDVPDASQSVLRLHLPGWATTDPDAALGELGIVALGGTFTSRLNRLLREEKGYTYGARAGVGGDADRGLVVVSTAVQRDVTAPALADLLGEVKRLPEGITAEEVGKAAGSRRTDAIESMATRSGVAARFVGLLTTGRSPDALASDLATIAAATPEAVNATLDRPSLTGSVLVVAGDLSAVEESVRAALPGDWVTAEPPR